MQYKQLRVTNRMRVASAVRETHAVEVGVSTRVGRALCLRLDEESSVLRLIGHVKLVHTCFLDYC